jgi:hypothetical protein
VDFPRTAQRDKKAGSTFGQTSSQNGQDSKGNNKGIQMSELDDLAKFIEEATGEPCEADDILHVKRAKEPYSGSPLESVVPGRPESPSLNPDRSRDAILAELRSRAVASFRASVKRQTNLDVQGLKRAAAFNRGTSDTLAMMLEWLDELSSAK